METRATNNIISKKGGTERFIRELVRTAKREGISLTGINEAVTTIWRDEQFKKEKYEFSALEKQFSEKVKRFLKHYKTALIVLYNQQKDQEEESVICNKYYEILCSMYAAFEREGKICIKSINRSIDSYFEWLSNYCTIQDISFLRTFICRLHFVSEDTPIFSENVTGEIYHIKEFRTQREFYQVLNNTVFDTSLAMIWLIEKYF